MNFLKTVVAPPFLSPLFPLPQSMLPPPVPSDSSIFFRTPGGIFLFSDTSICCWLQLANAHGFRFLGSCLESKHQTQQAILSNCLFLHLASH